MKRFARVGYMITETIESENGKLYPNWKFTSIWGTDLLQPPKDEKCKLYPNHKFSPV